MINKKITSILLTSVIVLTNNIVPSVVYGIPNTSIENTTNQVKDLISKQEDLKTSIQKSDAEIEKLLKQNDDLKIKIKNCEEKIKSSEQIIKKTNKKLKETEDIMNERLRMFYIQDNFKGFSYLNVIFSSSSISEFLGKVEAVKSIMKLDNEMMNEIQNNKKLIEDTKETLVKEQNENTKAKETLTKQLELIKNEKIKQENQLKELQTQVTDMVSNKNIAFDKEILEQLSKFGLSASVGKNAVKYASTFLGTPYVWGGTTPDGFDCSGLMQYVYNHLGISIPRVAEDQQNVGIDVPIEKAQPGDLVFFGLPAHHVGMYVGNGVMIHAPFTGEVVKFEQVNMNSITNIKRMTK